ncbi:MAG TPA: hypothetical protein VI136_11445 [Verrucomicrobiae bacterium]
MAHHVEVTRLTQHLMHELGCDGWHAASRHEHQLVVLLTRGGLAKYCVAYDCSPACEKAIYHGSRAWALALTPLHVEDNLPAQKVMALKAGLGALHGGA